MITSETTANMDSVVIDRWQGEMRAICSGFGHVMTMQFASPSFGSSFRNSFHDSHGV